jgi:hypothetical protein
MTSSSPLGSASAWQANVRVSARTGRLRKKAPHPDLFSSIKVIALFFDLRLHSGAFYTGTPARRCRVPGSSFDSQIQDIYLLSNRGLKFSDGRGQSWSRWSFHFAEGDAA